MNYGAPSFLPGWRRKLRFNIVNVCSPYIKQKKYTHAKVFHWGKTAACSTEALGFPFIFVFFIMSTEWNVSQHRHRVVIRRDWFRCRASLPRNESGYICCWARENSSPIRPFLSSVSFLISVRSHCLIVSRRADVSGNRINFLPSPSFTAVFFYIRIIFDEHFNLSILLRLKSLSDYQNSISIIFVFKNVSPHFRIREFLLFLRTNFGMNSLMKQI